MRNIARDFLLEHMMVDACKAHDAANIEFFQVQGCGKICHGDFTIQGDLCRYVEFVYGMQTGSIQLIEVVNA